MDSRMRDELLKKLNYRFNQDELLTVALTHRSRGGDNNERLEFLGDAIINFIVAELLYYRFPTAAEGELSRWRATLVNRDALAQLAMQFDLGKYLLLGQGEMRSGGAERPSILSCAMEAVIGAVYLDSGYQITRSCVEQWYQSQLQALSSASSHKDPKTLLQEYLQSKRVSLPTYAVEAIEGEAHQQKFKVGCYVVDLKLSTFGTGTSRRRAEQEAAQNMLDELKNLG